MIRLLFVFLYLAHLVQGTSTNITSSSSPPPDATSRSVWSILGSCALTLLICVWQAIHPDVPDPLEKWYKTRVYFILLSFFVPEAMVAKATEEWWEARRNGIQFHEKGFEWSMTHAHFAEMDGFVYREYEGSSLRIIDSLQFLQLCEAGKIANPVITAKEIKDKSKSDSLGKTIFALQLFWFTLQVAVRHWSGLAITLVELDTVCMAVLTLLLLFFWWDKPLRPECPHIFYSLREAKLILQTDLSNVWKSEPSYLYTLMARFVCIRKTRLIPRGSEETPLVGADGKPIHSKRGKPTAGIREVDEVDVAWHVSLCAAWFILGGLHLIAWNYDFPTGTEKIIWRVASLVLAGAPIVFIIAAGFNFALESVGDMDIAFNVLKFCVLLSGVASRALLVALMLASLHSLPSSVYQTISWTAYIPHL